MDWYSNYMKNSYKSTENDKQYERKMDKDINTPFTEIKIQITKKRC